MNRRDDRAFISIKVEPELLPYLERYKDSLGDRAFNFFVRYSTHKQFVHKVNAHLKKVGDELGIPDLTLYAARHSWATIARNDCGISLDDVAMCLNHKSGHDVTDTYIKKDWSIIDRRLRIGRIKIARFLDGLILMSGIFSTSIVVNMANHPMNVDS